MKKKSNLICLTFEQVKNQFDHFGDLIKMFKKIIFEFYFWGLFFEVKGRYMQIFRNEYLFLRSLWIIENENFATRVAKFADVLELDTYKYTWSAA